MVKVENEKILGLFDDLIDEVYEIRDYFNKKCYLLVNSTMKEIRIVGEDPFYKKRRIALDKMKLNNVKSNRWLDVIDLTEKTAREIESEFPGYYHTEWNIWNN